jgi:hypothetical protein
LNKLRVGFLCILAFLTATYGALAQDSASPAPASASSSNFSPEQLDQLVAPVALYPDPLLADVLTGSTYPLEVVDADHWVADPQNSGLSGDDLTDALSARGWDPSVQSLVPFPQVLQLMDNHLDWMETLGEAFLAQPGDVMDAVQRMRVRAQSAGNLASNGEEMVTDQDGAVAISPPSDLIDIPEYDPWCAFGDWPYPVASPFYFSAWSGNCDPADYSVVFGPGIAWPFPFWGWGYFDWRHHHVLLHPDKYRQFHPNQIPKSGVWTHDPRHRDGALYRNARNIRAFGQPVARGIPLRMGTNLPVRPVRSAPPARNWSPVRTFRLQPRPAMPAGGNNRAGFGQPAPGIGKAHASRTPDHR